MSASVAGLSGSAQRTAVRGSTVPADVAELSASIALHGLGLTITGVVVGSAALVAGSRSGTSESSTTSESKPSTAHRRTSTESTSGGAVTSQMTGVTAAVASSSSSSSRKSQGRAISLNVAETLAVVALLGIRSPGLRANIGFMTRLFAVVAKALGRCANFCKVADGTALVTSSSGQRHDRRNIKFVIDSLTIELLSLQPLSLFFFLSREKRSKTAQQLLASSEPNVLPTPLSYRRR